MANAYADPITDQSEANRIAAGLALFAHFFDRRADSSTTGNDDAAVISAEASVPAKVGGRSFAERLESRRELGRALKVMRRRRPDLWLIVSSIYNERLTLTQVAKIVHLSRTTLRHRKDDALDDLIALLGT